jgi:hypothetical protein
VSVDLSAYLLIVATERRFDCNEESLDVPFSMRSGLYQRKVGDCFCPKPRVLNVVRLSVLKVSPSSIFVSTTVLISNIHSDVMMVILISTDSSRPHSPETVSNINDLCD